MGSGGSSWYQALGQVPWGRLAQSRERMAMRHPSHPLRPVADEGRYALTWTNGQWVLWEVDYGAPGVVRDLQLLVDDLTDDVVDQVLQANGLDQGVKPRLKARKK